MTPALAWQVVSALLVIAFAAGSAMYAIRQMRKDANGIGSKVERLQWGLLLLAKDEAQKEKLISLLKR